MTTLLYGNAVAVYVIMKARNGFGIENTEVTGWAEGKGREGVGFCGVEMGAAGMN